MKAISLWQPWASFKAIDEKRIETRGRPTHYRGDLVICATLKKPDLMTVHPDVVRRLWPWRRQLLADPTAPVEGTVDVYRALPTGAALCVVEVYDCLPTEQIIRRVDLFGRGWEAALGNYALGRFGWLTRNCRRLTTPVPVKGKQGFFNLPPDVEAKVRAQL
jgi:hypothetical protein